MNMKTPERGNWRKFNPNNPYTGNENLEREEETKIESLDSLFEPSEDVADREVVNNNENSNIGEPKKKRKFIKF